MTQTTLDKISVAVIAARLDGDYSELRGRVRRMLVEHADVMNDALEWPKDVYRERVLELVVEAANTGLTGSGFPVEYGGLDDFGGNVAAFETLAFGDLSVLVKFGVQFGLFGG